MILLGSKEYMLIDQISKDDFITKRCFQQDFSADQSMANQSVANQSVVNQTNTSNTMKRKLPDFVSPLKAANPNDGQTMETSNLNDEIMETPNKLFKSSDSSFSRLESKKENVTEQCQIFQVFSVVFGPYKAGKKHKEWTDDGVIARQGVNITLYNQEGDK